MPEHDPPRAGALVPLTYGVRIVRDRREAKAAALRAPWDRIR